MNAKVMKEITSKTSKGFTLELVNSIAINKNVTYAYNGLTIENIVNYPFSKMTTAYSEIFANLHGEVTLHNTQFQLWHDNGVTTCFHYSPEQVETNTFSLDLLFEYTQVYERITKDSILNREYAVQTSNGVTIYDDMNLYCGGYLYLQTASTNNTQLNLTCDIYGLKIS